MLKPFFTFTDFLVSLYQHSPESKLTNRFITKISFLFFYEKDRKIQKTAQNGCKRLYITVFVSIARPTDSVSVGTQTTRVPYTRIILLKCNFHFQFIQVSHIPIRILSTAVWRYVSNDTLTRARIFALRRVVCSL